SVPKSRWAASAATSRSIGFFAGRLFCARRSTTKALLADNRGFGKEKLAARCFLGGCPHTVEREKLLQNFRVRQVVGPAVRVQNGSIEGLMREMQPHGSTVVEVRQRSALQLCFGNTCWV